MKNIVFIGMPGSGKTTVSKRVAEVLGRPCYDSDTEIEMSEGLSISEIFEKWGEARFRELETECLEKLTALEGAVISVGGGAIVNNEALLRENSVVVYITRSPENILATLEPGTRPLLKDTENIHALYEKRRAIYERTRDFTVDNNGEIEDTVKKVLEALA